MLLIEVSTTQVVIGAVVTILSGGAFGTLLAAWLNRRKTAVEIGATEGAGMDTLLAKIKTLMGEKLQDFTRIQDLSTQLAAQKVLIEVRDAELTRQGEVLKQIILEQGRAEERERQCQSRLTQVMAKLEEYGDLHHVNRRLVQDNLRMQGELDECSRHEAVSNE